MAVAAVADRRNRTMRDQQVAAMRRLGSRSARSARARTGVRIGGVGEAFEKGVVLAELRNIVVAVEHWVEVGIAVLGSEDMELPALADCIATFCSCLDTAPGIVLARFGVEGSLDSHHGLAAVVAHSCRTVVRCRSSSFPCPLEGS